MRVVHISEGVLAGVGVGQSRQLNSSLDNFSLCSWLPARSMFQFSSQQVKADTHMVVDKKRGQYEKILKFKTHFRAGLLLQLHGRERIHKSDMRSSDGVEFSFVCPLIL